MIRNDKEHLVRCECDEDMVVVHAHKNIARLVVGLVELERFLVPDALHVAEHQFARPVFERTDVSLAFRNERAVGVTAHLRYQVESLELLRVRLHGASESLQLNERGEHIWTEFYSVVAPGEESLSAYKTLPSGVPYGGVELLSEFLFSLCLFLFAYAFLKDRVEFVHRVFGVVNGQTGNDVAETVLGFGLNALARVRSLRGTETEIAVVMPRVAVRYLEIVEDKVGRDLLVVHKQSVCVFALLEDVALNPPGKVRIGEKICGGDVSFVHRLEFVFKSLLLGLVFLNSVLLEDFVELAKVCLGVVLGFVYCFLVVFGKLLLFLQLRYPHIEIFFSLLIGKSLNLFARQSLVFEPGLACVGIELLRGILCLLNLAVVYPVREDIAQRTRSLETGTVFPFVRARFVVCPHNLGRGHSVLVVLLILGHRAEEFLGLLAYGLEIYRPGVLVVGVLLDGFEHAVFGSPFPYGVYCRDSAARVSEIHCRSQDGREVVRDFYNLFVVEEPLVF